MKKLVFLITTLCFLTGCSALNNGRGLTEQDKKMLQANPHVPLTL
jgi:uncharacterized lipoprotein